MLVGLCRLKLRSLYSLAMFITSCLIPTCLPRPEIDPLVSEVELRSYPVSRLSHQLCDLLSSKTLIVPIFGIISRILTVRGHPKVTVKKKRNQTNHAQLGINPER